MSFTASQRALMFLWSHGDAAACEVGAAVWPERVVRPGRGVATGGGGDYAAQMLLGRLKKDRLVEHARSEGSTRWRLSESGLREVHRINQP